MFDRLSEVGLVSVCGGTSHDFKDDQASRAEEHTIGMIRKAGFWASMTIYPVTKNSPPRVVDAIERFGTDHIMVDASGDWGPSDPVTLHEAVFEMKRRGHREADIETIFIENPARFLSQSPKFPFKPAHAS